LEKFTSFGAYIGPAGAAHFAPALQRNTYLTRLCLHEDKLGPEGCRTIVSALQENSILEIIAINFSGIGCEGCKEVAERLLNDRKVKSLKKLMLRGNGIGDAGCAYLSSALRRNCTLTALHLDLNNITSVAMLEMETTLRSANYSLVQFECDENQVPLEQRERLERLCRNNARLKELYSTHIEPDFGSNIPLSVWPRVLEVFSLKPGLMFSILRRKPDLFKERRNQRRRKRPDRLTY